MVVQVAGCKEAAPTKAELLKWGAEQVEGRTNGPACPIDILLRQWPLWKAEQEGKHASAQAVAPELKVGTSNLR